MLFFRMQRLVDSILGFHEGSPYGCSLAIFLVWVRILSSGKTSICLACSLIYAS
jgi:hypothetical protein